MTDPILVGMNWFLVLSLAMWPLASYTGLLKMVFEQDTPPAGCVLVAVLLLLAAPVIGWWAYANLAVAWR